MNLKLGQYLIGGSLSVLIYLLCSCSTGTHIERPHYSEFPFGINSPQDLIVRYGKPSSMEITSSHGETLTKYCYGYESLLEMRNSERGIGYACFFFSSHGNIGYAYVGAGKNKTAINTDLVKKITVGITTKTEVLDLLGEPHGVHHYPIPDVLGPQYEHLLYNAQSSDKDSIFTYAEIEIDSKDVVSRVIITDKPE